MKQRRTANLGPRTASAGRCGGASSFGVEGSVLAAPLRRVGEIKHKNTIKIKIPAFTLIEMLLSVAIFSIVLLAINAVFFSALHLERTTNRALDERLPLNQALAILRRDLLGAVQPVSNGVFLCDFKSGAVQGGLGASGAASTLEFCTTTGVINDDLPWGDTQRVSYQLVEPADRATSKGMDLVRIITRNLLPTMTVEADEQWLLGNVESLEFLNYTGIDWRNSWDTTMGDTGLPQAIRVRVQLVANNPGNAMKREPLEMLVPLTTQARTNQSTAGGAQ